MNKFFILSTGVMVIIFAVAGGYYLGVSRTNMVYSTPSGKGDTTDAQPNTTSASSIATMTNAPTNTKSKINLATLPLGDNKVSTSPKKGYIYSCQKQSESGGGAGKDGPWINQVSLTWNFTQKITVDGAVVWKNAKWSITEDGSNRVLTGNGLPSHTTGVYPIASTDDAYTYDRNPNSIKEQTLSLTLPVNPTILTSAECVGGEVGIMLTGIPLFNGFDAGSRDANAHEIQDTCSGHPQVMGMYHYHGPSKCLKDSSSNTEHSSLVGYAFDGFGIYGLKGENGVELSTVDLDECHGHTHEIIWEGKKVSMYHYHLTHDFPYSVGCFKGKKAQTSPLGGKGGGEGMQPPGMRNPPPGGRPQ